MPTIQESLDTLVANTTTLSSTVAGRITTMDSQIATALSHMNAAAASSNISEVSNLASQAAQALSEAARDASQAARAASESAKSASETGRNESQAARDLANNYKNAALAAQFAAESAQVLSEVARDQSIAAKIQSEAARDQSVIAKDQSIVAKNQSVTAKNQSEDARDQSVIAKDQSIEAKNQSVIAKDQSVAAKNESVVAKDASVVAKNQSEVARDQSIVAKDQSEDARDHSIAAKNKSEEWATKTTGKIDGIDYSAKHYANSSVASAAAAAVSESNASSSASAAAASAVDASNNAVVAINTILDGAPANLDTLNELAASLGDDANFAGTVTANLSNKADKTTRILGATGLSGGGDISGPDRVLFISDTGVTSGTYGSASEVPVITVNPQGQLTMAGTVSVAGVTDFDYSSTTAILDIDTADGGNYSTQINLNPFDTSDLAEGSNLYWTTARGNSMFDTRLATKSTTNVSEGTNLYHTTARARAAISATGSLSYNSSTGVMSYTMNNEMIQDVVGNMVSGNSESGISVYYQDADGTLDFNVNDPTISLSGDVSGSATMTNLGNVNITTSVGNDSHSHSWGNITGKPGTFTPTTENVQDIVGGMVGGNSESGISVYYQDADGTLDFNVHDPVISLSGDVTGSATMTNLGNVNISATVQNSQKLDGIDSTGFIRYFEQATAPSVTTAGTMWYDNDEDTLYQRQDGAWVQVSTSAAPAVLIYDVNGSLVN